jgi:hypothetical protein
MALSNNFLPQTSLVFGVRDFVPQIDAIQKGDTQGLQNAFKFGTQVYDYLQGRKQAALMEQDSNDKKALEDQIAADKERLELLKKDLATLQGGV